MRIVTAGDASGTRANFATSIDAQATFLAGTLGLLWFLLCRQLSNEWSANEQYRYGWFVPFFAAFLFWLRWEDRPLLHAPTHDRVSHRIALTFALASLFLLFPVRVFEVATPDWRLLDWLHAGVVVALTLLSLWKIGGRLWLKHFAFPVCFILVAVPWISPIETPIVQGLMRVVAMAASETLALCGIPAQLEGSVIRISSGVVGVNEACSGVRSLQTSLMIGLLFGELKRLTVWRRILLVAGAAAIAFAANCLRAFFLVWIASSHGVSALRQWHDFAGYIILGAVFLGTVGMAHKFAKGECGDDWDTEPTPPSRFQLPHFPPSTFYLLLSTFLYLFLVEASVSGWYRWHERNLVPTATWNVKWPTDNPGFEPIPIDPDVAATLRYDDGHQARWLGKIEPDNSALAAVPVAWSMFFFRWKPGSTSILRARAHRPDICLPNTGWQMTEDYGTRPYTIREGVAIPLRHFSFARKAGSGREIRAHAFFCEREDRVPRNNDKRFDATSGTTNNWMRSDRVRVVREGLRNPGQQVLELVLITSQPLEVQVAETALAKLLPDLVKESAP